jgi:fumarylpyruvate hydrolase
MTYAVQPPPVTTLPVSGTEETFPVSRVYCVGRNYAEHAVEMGHDPDRELPFFFAKPANAVVPNGGTLAFPSSTEDLHHEIELVVALGEGGADLTASAALSHVFGYAVGLDMTRRDLQAEAKKAGRPWDMAKGFDRSAPMSAICPVSAIGHPERGSIWLRVNDELRQQGTSASRSGKFPRPSRS